MVKFDGEGFSLMLKF